MSNLDNSTKDVLPIVDFEDTPPDVMGRFVPNGLPLCPHEGCHEWSYYTDSSAAENDGIHYCPFCGGGMFLEDKKPFGGTTSCMIC